MTVLPQPLPPLPLSAAPTEMTWRCDVPERLAGTARHAQRPCLEP